MRVARHTIQEENHLGDRCQALQPSTHPSANADHEIQAIPTAPATKTIDVRLQLHSFLYGLGIRCKNVSLIQRHNEWQACLNLCLVCNASQQLTFLLHVCKKAHILLIQKPKPVHSSLHLD